VRNLSCSSSVNVSVNGRHSTIVTMSSEAANIIKGTKNTDKDVSLVSLSLDVLPDSLFSLTHITSLKLSNNALTALPSSISTLRALEDLDVSRNLLTCDGVPRYGLLSAPLTLFLLSR
jgi:Leucine-rich repeat (LRR) protein